MTFRGSGVEIEEGTIRAKCAMSHASHVEEVDFNLGMGEDEALSRCLAGNRAGRWKQRWEPNIA